MDLQLNSEQEVHREVLVRPGLLLNPKFAKHIIMPLRPLKDTSRCFASQNEVPPKSWTD